MARYVIDNVSVSASITGYTTIKLTDSTKSKKLPIINRVRRCKLLFVVHCVDMNGKKKVTQTIT